MECSQACDIVGLEKQKAIARHDLLRKIASARQILELAALLGLISWSTGRVPAAAKAAASHAARISAHLLNHHVAFLVGNAIVVLLFLQFRRSDAVDGGLYDDYVKHSEAAAHRSEPAPPPPPPPEVAGGGVEPCDDVAAAIEKAERQIKRFQRTQSEKLRREIGARPRAVLRRSESENRRTILRGGGQIWSADMEMLSSEEFRRTVDAFIDKHWIKKKTKQGGVENYEKYQLLEVA